MNLTDLEGHMKLAHEEFQTIRGLNNQGGSPSDKKRLEDVQRHYEKIREQYHTKKAEIINDILTIVES